MRFCQRCQKYTLHDKCDLNERVEDLGLFGRVYFGIFTLGLSEMLREPGWRCQECGKETER